MQKDFIEKYNNLPVYNRNIYRRNYYSDYNPRFWTIDSKYVLKNITGSIQQLDFFWQAILFSFLSKSIYRCSPENYQYCLDYFWMRHDVDIRFIYRNKLQFFLDFEFLKIDKLSNLNTVCYSYENLNKYVSWLLDIVDDLNKKCCITDLPSRILSGEKDNLFMEEFSTEVNSLSNRFLKQFLKALKDDR